MAKNLVLAKAQNAILSHDWVTAARLYKELLRGNEKNVDYLMELGSIYVKAGEDEKAIPYYQQIITYYPHYIEAMNNLGAIFRRLKRYDESINILQKAKDEGRDKVSVNYNLGFTYKEMGKYDEAIDSFELVINENPDDVLAYNHLGSIYYAQKNYEKSIASFKRGLQVDPNHPILNYNLARCYEDSKNIPDAIRCYEATLKTRPGWKDAVRDFSELLIKSQKNAAAQDLVEKSIKLHPTDGDLMCILGRIFLNQFDYDNATKTFKKADSVKPNDIKILTGFSKALERGDNIAEALDKALEASEIDPSNKDVRKQYAHALLSAQRYDQALEQVKLLDSDTEGKDPQVLDLYGQYYICRGDEASAKEYYEKIQRLNQHYKNYMLEASDRYSQIGDLDKAKDYAQQFVERRAQSPEGYNRLGKIAIAKGDFKTAKEEFEKGQQLSRPNVLAAKGLSRVEEELAKNPALKDYDTPSIEIDAEKIEDQEDYIPESFKGEVVGQEKEETAEEFDYEQMGGDAPMGEALLEKDGDFWEDFDDDENAEESENDSEEEEDEDEEKMSPFIMTNPDTGRPYEEPGVAEEASEEPAEEENESSDDLLDALANSGDEGEMSPSEIDENTQDLDDIGNSLTDDSGDFDFSEFDDAEDTGDKSLEDSLSQRDEPENSIEEGNSGVEEDDSYMDMVPPASNQVQNPPKEEAKMPQKQAPVNPDPYENYQAPRMQQPAYDPSFDRQMQAAAMNNAGNAIEAAFVAQKMAQQLSDQQKQFEEALTLKNEKMIQETVEKAVNEKIQKSMDEQMEKIMTAEDEDVFSNVEEYIPEQKEENLSVEEPVIEEESPVEDESLPVNEIPVEEESAPVEEKSVEETSEEVELTHEPFASVDDYLSEDYGQEISVEETAVEETDPVEEVVVVEEELSDEHFAGVEDFAEEAEEEVAVEEPAAEEVSVEEAVVEEELSDEPFAGVDDFAEEAEEEVAVEEPAAEEVSVEEAAVEEELSDEPFAGVDEFAEEAEEEVVVEEPAAEEEASVEEAAVEEELSDEPFAGVDEFAEEAEEEVAVEDPAAEEEVSVEEPAAEDAASSSEYKDIIDEIEEKLSDPDAAKTNAEQIELFKSLKVLASFMPDNQKDSYISCKIRMVLEYLIAKLSGKPGLLITAEALLESGVLGQEYSGKLEETSDENLSNDLIKHVISYMKKLAGQLEDSSLSCALCTSADSILEKIELENSESQIF